MGASRSFRGGRNESAGGLAGAGVWNFRPANGEARVSPLLDEGCEGWRWLREATRPLDEGEGALAAAGGGAEAATA